jgi:hypothetical protein
VPLVLLEGEVPFVTQVLLLSDTCKVPPEVPPEAVAVTLIELLAVPAALKDIVVGALVAGVIVPLIIVCA